MYWVYILQSQKDRRTYVGYTSNLKERFSRHNEGRVLSTKHRRPLKILHTEAFEDIQEAKVRELWWKGSSGRKKLREYFENKQSL